MILTANLKIYENLKTWQLNRKQNQRATEETEIIQTILNGHIN